MNRKEDLKEKFQTDNKSWDAVRVEEEAVRYMMDCENVNMYLKYLQDRNENPEKYRAEALENELSLSNPKTVSINYDECLAEERGMILMFDVSLPHKNKFESVTFFQSFLLSIYPSYFYHRLRRMQPGLLAVSQLVFSGQKFWHQSSHQENGNYHHLCL